MQWCQRQVGDGEGLGWEQLAVLIVDEVSDWDEIEVSYGSFVAVEGGDLCRASLLGRKESILLVMCRV